MRRLLASLTVALIVVIGGALLLRRQVIDGQRETCSALHARLVRTGHGHFLCVAPDGRIVGS